jgi:hypothetical protein
VIRGDDEHGAFPAAAGLQFLDQQAHLGVGLSQRQGLEGGLCARQRCPREQATRGIDVAGTVDVAQVDEQEVGVQFPADTQGL